MAKLEQELRGFDKEKFESFVHQYLVAKYPGADIKKVEGAGGDGGLDSFEGTLSSGPSIWQSKHFPDRIREPQKKQIVKSISAAFKNAPSLWTLCVPIDLRTDEHRWFQEKIVSAHGGPERIKLLQASELLTEVRHNRPLRDEFFPESAQSETLKVRKILTKTEGLTQNELSTAAVEYAQQYLESDMNLEPRLKAVLSIGGSPRERQPPNSPGLVMSITRGEQSVSYFARDPVAFNLDPIQLQMKMSPEGHTAIQNALDTGRRLTLSAGSILEITASSPLLQSQLGNTDISSARVEMTPRMPPELANKTIPVRLTAGSGASAQILPYVPFKLVRPGRSEMEFRSEGQIPAEMSLVVRLSEHGQSNFHISPKFLNSDACQAYRLLEFLDELERSREFEVYSLEIQAPLLKQSGAEVNSGLRIAPGFRDVVSKAAAVSESFKVPLRLPPDFTDAEYSNLEMLWRIATGEPFPNFELQATLTKRAENEAIILAGLEGPSFSVKLENPSERTIMVLGTKISIGPVVLIGDDCSFKDAASVRAKYVRAQEGQQIPIAMRCAGLARFSRVTAENLTEPVNAE